MEALTLQDLSAIGFLVFLEGILSIDNALVLAMLARGLEPKLQRKALTYGLVGAVVFRFFSLFIVSQLMKWTWVKFVGGAYLLFIAIKHFVAGEKSHEDQQTAARSFWKTVLVIELTDVAFAVDSILAAVAVSNKFIVVFIGGVLGIVMMRFAASAFLKLLNRFPGFESTAYLLVLLIGAKLFIDGFHFEAVDFHSSSNPAFWIFWSSMLGCIFYGFLPRKRNRETRETEKAIAAEEQAIKKLSH
jgi:YkoY family integral membrane protein